MVSVVVFEFGVMRCQPLRRALTLSHASVKTSPFVTLRYRSVTFDVHRTYVCGLFLRSTLYFI
ncbi:hypothetical protein FXE36_12730 [Vibrio cholerae]|nr:hypothetical protein FXE36_12730 [Vibrio cholerae]